MTIELLSGPWQTTLVDRTFDAVISDNPYGKRTHDGNADMLAKLDRGTLDYTCYTPAQVHEFVGSFSPRTRGWMACMTSDDLVQVWRGAYAAAGRFDFAPVPILQHRPRLGGDGPGSGTVYLMVARPRSAAFMSWGSLPCWYECQPEKSGIVTGAKPIGLMRALVRDYSRAGEMVCDPCAGGATTLVAAALEGRHAIGSEVDSDTFEKASARIRRDVDSDDISTAMAREGDRPKRVRGKQMGLPGMDVESKK